MTKISHKGVHIRLEEPISKRKDVLEAAIFATELLQKNENFKKIRNLKQKQRALFKKTMKEVELLMNELELKELPHMKIEKPEIKVKEEIKELKIAKKKIKELPKAKSKLTQELEDIRAKLQKLQI